MEWRRVMNIRFGNDFAISYLMPLIEKGSKHFISNAETQALFLTINGIKFPSGINYKEYTSSYVCSIYNALVSYGAEESRKIGNLIIEYPIRFLTAVLSSLLKLGKINKNIFVNNYLLSTNLYPDWLGEGLGDFTEATKIKYPNHAIIFRSLNYHTNVDQLIAFEIAGYILVPTRQVYIFDKKLGDYELKRDLKKDRKIRNKSKYIIEEHANIFSSDFSRIVELYNKLYLKKYSKHNPQYNVNMISHWHSNNLLTFFGLRNSDGILDGVVGIFENETTVSAPHDGYDTALAKKLGLYRQLISLTIDYAAKKRKILNLSSGASDYKLNRGGKPFIEYAAVYTKHLPFYRRVMWEIIRILLDRIIVQILRKYKL